MAKPRSRVMDYGVYLLVRLLVSIVQGLPERMVWGLADALAWAAYHVDRRHRAVARDNLSHAFPEWTAARRDRVVRGVYRHFSRMVFEIALFPRKIHPSNWRKYLELTDGHRLVDVLTSRHPVLLVTGHFGNWEIAGVSFGLLGLKTAAIARRLDNPYLEEFFGRFRRKTGQVILDKNEDYLKMDAVLAGNGVLATVADQDAGQRGLFVDFFGRPASTHKAVALFALRHKAVLVVGGCPRVAEPMRYHSEIADVIWPEEYEGKPDAVRAITERFTAGLEKLIRRHPEQYLWLHRRWKHQPLAKEKKKAA